jgi:hypothetical protein
VQISIAEAIVIYQKLGLDAPKLGKALARRVVADGTRQVLTNLNDDLLMRRTGGFARYVAMSLKAVEETPTSLTVGLPRGQLGAVIGRVQETGATIRPTRAQSLIIPLPPARTKAGAARDLFGPSGERAESIRGALAPDGSPFFRPKGKEVVGITRGEGKNRHFEAWYVLRREVTLRARHWWSSGWKFAGNRIGEHAMKVVPAFLRGTNPDAL